MTEASAPLHAGARRRRVIAVAAGLLLVPALASRARAQEPVPLPADTAGADTVQVPIPPEGVVSDTIPDELLTTEVDPAPSFPRMPRPGREGWAWGVRSWDRNQLDRYHGLSLLQLLERLPGVHILRSGNYGQPAGITTMGGAGSRVRVFMDGFELDPLGFTALDLQQIALGDLEHVRVERRFDGVRVDLTPIRLDDGRPLSGIEAATGVYGTKLLRALLVRGIGSSAMLSAGFDQASSRGVGFDEPFSYSSARASLSYALGRSTFVQAEYRVENPQAGQGSAPVDASRRTLLLRGRSTPLPGLTLDAAWGRVDRRPEDRDTLDVDLRGSQGSLRAVYDLGWLWGEGGVRLRGDAERLGLPSTELEGRLGLRLLPWLAAQGEIRSASIGGTNGTHGAATVRLGPLAGLSGFASVGFGSQPLALVRDSSVQRPRGDDESVTETLVEPYFSAISASTVGTRLGGEWSLPAASIGAAAVFLPKGEVVPLGLLRIDRGVDPLEVGSANGFEARASVPVPLTREYLRLEGSYTRWLELGDRPYLPEEEARLAAQAHGIFFAGDLEPSLRVEVVRRGSMWALTGREDEPLRSTLPYEMANLQLEIRILDVRAFFVMDNFTNIRTATDFPDVPLPGPFFYYGLRWTFRD